MPSEAVSLSVMKVEKNDNISKMLPVLNYREHFAYHFIIIFIIIYPKSVQAGKVNIQAVTMLRVVFAFILPDDSAPTPRMDEVFVCVVLAGIPIMLANKRHKALAISEAKPSFLLISTISSPTDFIIFFPPTAVPMSITTDTANISGVPTSPPFAKSKNRPINFTPS